MWYFRRKLRGEKIRDPIQGEFFATEAIANPAQALVRESIQNSLDAGTGGPVTVRLYLGTGSAALPWSDVSEFLRGAWGHFEAPGNGLVDVPTQNERCSYLLVEDFGTSGLIGDQQQSDPIPGKKNPFFLFFRAEGRSEKGETERGRWGVGKFVFPRSSRISTHFGLTVRADDGRKFLMGAATLKSHIIDNSTFCPDGLFGVPDQGGEFFVLPIEDPGKIRNFESAFRISRKDEPGLSVLVPYIDQDITFHNLVSAAAKDYFFPILDGALSIRIETEDRSVVLESSTIENTLAELRSAADTDPAAELSKVAAYVSLAKWGTSSEQSEQILLDVAGTSGRPRWTPDLISEGALSAIRDRLRNHQPIWVRARMMVRPKRGSERESYFDIFCVHERGADGRPLFVREGIVISDTRAPRARELRSLVVIRDKPLATLLGDSENPAHTQWQKDGSNFRGKYTFGPGCLDFVEGSVSELMKLIEAEKKEDPSLTVDFFSIPRRDAEETEKTSGSPETRKKPGETSNDRQEIPKTQAKLVIERKSGGFVVKCGPGAPAVPFGLTIRVAYDVRNGNPLKKYHVADFDLSRLPVEVDSDTVSKLVRKGNTLGAIVLRNDIRLDVSGFDEHRDLYVSARVIDGRETEHADSES